MGKLVLLYVLALKVTVSENQLAKLNEEILYGNTVICIDVLFLVAFFTVLFVYIIIVYVIHKITFFLNKIFLLSMQL